MIEVKGKQFLVFSGKSGKKLFVFRRDPVFNRSMGKSIVEELFEAQNQVNEGANLAIEDLRASSKNVFVTTDKELDGLDLSELTNLTVIGAERDTEFRQLYKTNSSYNALENYIDRWSGVSKEQGQATNAALGLSEGSREAVGVRGLKLQEINGTFGFEKEIIALELRKVFKRDGGLLDIMYGYFSNLDNIEKLLTKEQRRSFYMYIAESLADSYKDLLFVKSLKSVSIDDVKQSLYDALDSGNLEKFVDFTDIFMDKKDFIDKVRVNIVGEQVDRLAKLETLKLLAQQMMQNPQAYQNSNFTIQDVTNQIAELSDTDTLVELFNHMKSAKINSDGVTSVNDPQQNNRPPISR